MYLLFLLYDFIFANLLTDEFITICIYFDKIVLREINKINWDNLYYLP